MGHSGGLLFHGKAIKPLLAHVQLVNCRLIVLLVCKRLGIAHLSLLAWLGSQESEEEESRTAGQWNTGQSALVSHLLNRMKWKYLVLIL